MTDLDQEWFPVRITAVGTGLYAGQYTFQEVWALPGGTIADKIGGRVNTAYDPAYAIDGATFAVTAEGSDVAVLARRAAGAGGVQWELRGRGTAYGLGNAFSSVNLLASPTNTLVDVASLSVPAGTYMVWARVSAIASISATAGNVGAIYFRLYDGTSYLTGDVSLVVANGVATPGYSGLWEPPAVTANSYLVAAAPVTLKVQAYRAELGTVTWGTATVYVNTGGIGYHRI